MLAAGSPDSRLTYRRSVAGFTLLELLVVLAIVALASAGVGFALRDGTQTRLEREAQRLGALYESARARSQVSGVPVRWLVTAQGFRFDGLPKSELKEDELSQEWLDSDTNARVEERAELMAQASTQSSTLLLGPDPIIEPQSVILISRSQPTQQVRLATDGVRPFAVQPLLP